MASVAAAADAGPHYPSAAAAAAPAPDIWSSMPESKVRTISSIINVCERTTLSMEREGVGNAIKAIVVICMKFVDKVVGKFVYF